MTFAATLAAFCSRTATAPLPAAVEERARLCVADHLHAAMYGVRSETGDRLIRYLGLNQGSATAPGAESIALVLGAASAVHEIDDVHQDTSMHTGSVVVSAALGCLADAPVLGQRLLAAVAAGYEVGIRLSIAAGERHYHFFHATATCGTVAAAAAASVIYGLDEAETAHALGAAVTSASGLWEDINDEAIGIKQLHSGFAAERGIRAAKLARLGLRAARRSIEGDKGFLAAMARPGTFAPRETAPSDARLEEILVEGLGTRWAILRNIYKRYPFCLACFEPLEGIRHIIDGATRSKDEVRSVLVEMYPPSASLVEQPDPQDELQAKFSAPFAMALVLAGYDAEAVILPKEWLSDPAVRRWYPNVRIVATSEVPRRRARVTVQWNDGTQDVADQPLRSLTGPEAWARFAAACRQFLGGRAGELERNVAGRAGLADTKELLTLVRAAIGV